MPVRKYDFTFDQPYHIYNRGADKRTLFFEEKDYHKFLDGIQRYHKDFKNVTFLAYALLPNHFHFLILEKSSPGSTGGINISKYMNFIQQSYAMYFNAHHKDKKKQKGPIFEGRFQARVVEDEAYLAQLKDYIEYNPVKHGIVNDPRDWPYSSFVYHERDIEFMGDLEDVFD